MLVLLYSFAWVNEGENKTLLGQLGSPRATLLLGTVCVCRPILPVVVALAPGTQGPRRWRRLESCTEYRTEQKITSRIVLMLTRPDQRPSTTSAEHWENNADRMQVVRRRTILNTSLLFTAHCPPTLILPLPFCPVISRPGVCS